MSVQQNWRNIFGLCVVLTSLLSSTLVWAGSQQAEETPYTAEEYAVYQKAINEPDPVKKEEAIVAMIRADPESALVIYAVGSYIELMLEFQKKGQAREVVQAGERLLAVQPEDLNALNMTAVSAYQLGQFDKTVKYGEKVYAQNPSAGLAFILANSYLQLKNEGKFLDYGEKASAELAPKDCYQILAELTRVYAGKQQWNKGSQTAEKAIKGLDVAQKPTQTSEKDWKDYVNRQKGIAYAVVGRRSAERKSWHSAISNYQKALSFYSTPNLRAEAFYYTGLGQWRQTRIEEAMESFARSSVIGGAPHAKPSRKHLETLYKSTHNDSLAGINEFVRGVTGR
jgi:tetratricopeptide (TPR) repeat protein